MVQEVFELEKTTDSKKDLTHTDRALWVHRVHGLSFLLACSFVVATRAAFVRHPSVTKNKCMHICVLMSVYA